MDNISQFNPPMANMINDMVCLQQEIDVISAELWGLCKSNVLWNAVSHFFQLFLHQTLALVCASTSAFAPQPSAFVSKELSASAPVIDNLGSNLAVKNLLLNVESSAGLLTKVAKSGLISKAQEEQDSRRSWHFSFQVGTIVTASHWPRDPSSLANHLWLGPTCLSHFGSCHFDSSASYWSRWFGIVSSGLCCCWYHSR